MLFLEEETVRLAILVTSVIWLVGHRKTESAKEVTGPEVGLRTHLRFNCCNEWFCVTVYFLYVCDAGEVGQYDAAVLFDGFDCHFYIMQRHTSSHYDGDLLFFLAALSGFW